MRSERAKLGEGRLGYFICSNKPIRLDRLDAAMWADVRAVLERPEELRQELERRLSGENEPDVVHRACSEPA